MDWCLVESHSSVYPWRHLSTKVWGPFQQNTNNKKFQISVCVTISWSVSNTACRNSPLLVKQGHLKNKHPPPVKTMLNITILIYCGYSLQASLTGKMLLRSVYSSNPFSPHYLAAPGSTLIKYHVPFIIHLPNNPYEPNLLDQVTQTPLQNRAASPHYQQMYYMQEAVRQLLRPLYQAVQLSPNIVRHLSWPSCLQDWIWNLAAVMVTDITFYTGLACRRCTVEKLKQILCGFFCTQKRYPSSQWAAFPSMMCYSRAANRN